MTLDSVTSRTVGTSRVLADALQAGESVKDIVVAQEALDYLRQHGSYRDQHGMTVELVEHNGRSILKCAGQAWLVLFDEPDGDDSFLAQWVD